MSLNSKMTAIADNIRSITGKTEKLNLDEMALSINEVYDIGYDDGKSQSVTEIEITSTITNVVQLAGIVFENINTQTNYACAVLKKPKNVNIIDNQVIILCQSPHGGVGFRYRNGNYSYILISKEYDANTSIGDIYEVVDLGEKQYGN
jgi:hypothetical protein